MFNYNNSNFECFIKRSCFAKEIAVRDYIIKMIL